MDSILARDPRAAAILTSPDDYFAKARARAWMAAGRDVLDDLGRREARRRNGPARDRGELSAEEGRHA